MSFLSRQIKAPTLSSSAAGSLTYASMSIVDPGLEVYREVIVENGNLGESDPEEIPRAFVDDLRREGFALRDYCGNFDFLFV